MNEDTKNAYVKETILREAVMAAEEEMARRIREWPGHMSMSPGFERLRWDSERLYVMRDALAGGLRESVLSRVRSRVEAFVSAGDVLSELDLEQREALIQEAVSEAVAGKEKERAKLEAKLDAEGRRIELRNLIWETARNTAAEEVARRLREWEGSPTKAARHVLQGLDEYVLPRVRSRIEELVSAEPDSAAPGLEQREELARCAVYEQEMRLSELTAPLLDKDPEEEMRERERRSRAWRDPEKVMRERAIKEAEKRRAEDKEWQAAEAARQRQAEEEEAAERKRQAKEATARNAKEMADFWKDLDWCETLLTAFMLCFIGVLPTSMLGVLLDTHYSWITKLLSGACIPFVFWFVFHSLVYWRAGYYRDHVEICKVAGWWAGWGLVTALGWIIGEQFPDRKNGVPALIASSIFVTLFCVYKSVQAKRQLRKE